MQVASGLSIITKNNILHNQTRLFQQVTTRQERMQNKKILTTYRLVAIINSKWKKKRHEKEGNKTKVYVLLKY